MSDAILTPAAPPTITAPPSGVPAQEPPPHTIQQPTPNAAIGGEIEQGLAAAIAQAGAQALATGTTTPAVPVPPAPAPATEPPNTPTASPTIPDLPPTKAADWKAVKEKHAAEKATLEARLKELEARPTAPPDYEKLKAERDDLDSRLQAIAAERHPKFQEQFAARAAQISSVVKGIADGVKAEQIESLLRLPPSSYRDSQLEAIASDLPPLKAGMLVNAMMASDALQNEQQQLVAKGKDTWKQLQELEQKRSAETKTALERTFESRMREWTDPANGLPAYQKRDGDAAWNAQVDQRIQLAKAAYLGDQSLDPQKLASFALWGAAAPALLQDAQAKAGRIAELEAELATFRKGTPSPGSGPAPGLAPSNEPVDAQFLRGVSEAFAIR